MQVDIISIGNSKGIRLPKAVLQQCGFGDSAELVVKGDQVILKPIQARSGWRKAFQAMAETGDDHMLDEIAADHRFDADEWTW